MSRGIHPKCHEQCPRNAAKASGSVFIETKKVTKNFWLDLLAEKWPEGIGDVSESLKNDLDLVPEDFLETIGGSESDSLPSSCSSTKVLYCQEFKTPVLPKDRSNGNLNETPCLFTPDLPPQKSQDAKEPALHNQWKGFMKSPDILDQLISEKQLPRRSLPLLAVDESDGDVAEWSDSMATPPLHWSLQSQEGTKDSPGDSDKNSSTKHVARTLFRRQSGAKEDHDNTSLEVSLLSSLGDDSSVKVEDDTLCEAAENLWNTYKVELDMQHPRNNLDSSILQLLSTEYNVSTRHMRSSDELEQQGERETTRCPSRIEKTGHSFQKYVETSKRVGDFKASESNVSQSVSSPISQNTTMVMFPPSCGTGSPLLSSQDIKGFSVSAQSTPKVPHIDVKRRDYRVLKGQRKGYKWSQSSSEEVNSEYAQYAKEINEVRAAIEEPAEKVDVFLGSLMTPNPSDAASNERLSKSNNVNIILESNSKLVSGPQILDSSGRPLETSFNETEPSSSGVELNVTITSPTRLNGGFSTESLKQDKSSSTSQRHTLLCGSDVSFESPTLSMKQALVQLTDAASRKYSPSRDRKEVSYVSFGSPSTSFEEAMAKEADKVLFSSAKVCKASETGTFAAERMADNCSTDDNKYRSKALSNQQRTPINVDIASSLSNHLLEIHRSDNVCMGANNVIKVNPTIRTAIIGSACKVSGLRRSASNKRFSYPVSRQTTSSNDSILSETVAETARPDVSVPEKGMRGVPKDSSKPDVAVQHVHLASAKIINVGEQGAQGVMTGKTPLTDHHQHAPNEMYLDEVYDDLPIPKRLKFDDLCDTKLGVHRDISSDGSKDCPSLENMDNGASEPKVYQFEGFRTGSGKTITISEKALKDAAWLFNSIKEADLTEQGFNCENDGSALTLTKHDESHAENITDKTLEIDVDVRAEVGTVSESLFDMDALSQFPVELLSPTRKSHHQPISVSSSIGVGILKSETSSTKQDSPDSFDFPRQQGRCGGASFTGFQTESGRAVKTSEDALRNAEAALKRIDLENSNITKHVEAKQSSSNPSFREILPATTEETIKVEKSMVSADFEQDETKQSSSEPPKKSFRMAREKMVDMSEKSPEKASVLFSKGLDDFEHELNQNRLKAPPFSGFRTASGKRVEVSEESLQKARKAAQRVDEFEQEEAKQGPKAPLFSGFGTASGKKVEVSEEFLIKARAILQKMDMESNDSFGEEVANQSFSKPPAFSGFKTASGKKVGVSVEAVKKATATLQRIDREISNKLDDVQEAQRYSKIPSFSGFKTASGKKVEISEDSIKKATATLQRIDREISDSLDNVQELQRYSKPHSFSGFKTASGKKVEMFEDSIKKATATLQKIDQEISDSFDNVQELQRYSKLPSFSGFKTASGKKVEMSEDSIKKATATLQKIDQEISDSLDNVQELQRYPKPPSFSGFKTASGKKVEMSEDSIKKATATLQKIDQEISDRLDNVQELQRYPKPPSFSGFKTASGKKVGVSKEAIEKAKMYLNEIDTELAGDNNMRPASFCGFQTASGGKVEVSEDALKKVRESVSEVNDCDTFGAHEEQPSSRNKIISSRTTSGNLTSRRAHKAVDYKEPRLKFDQLDETSHSHFHSATGHRLEAPQKASLNECREMSKIDKELNSIGLTFGIREPKGDNSFSGFQTASGKKVDISEEALQKARNTICKIDKDIHCNVSTSAEKQQHLKSFSGFSSRHHVEITEEATQNAGARTNKIDRDSLETAAECVSFCGFQTANGKDVHISEDALRKARSTLRGIDQELSSEEGFKTIGEKESDSFLGFRTASGKGVKISEDALARARKVFNEEDKELNTGFPTASSQRNDIPDEALKNVSRGIDQHCNTKVPSSVHTTTLLSPINENCNFSGFKTASGRNVDISKAALQKAKRTLEGIDHEINLSRQKSDDRNESTNTEILDSLSIKGFHNTRTAQTGCGFQTASGKVVTVSDEALAKARATMIEIDREIGMEDVSSSTENEMSSSNATVHQERQINHGKQIGRSLADKQMIKTSQSDTSREDQQVPLFVKPMRVLPSMSRCTLVGPVSSSAIQTGRTSFTSSCTADLDENISREVLESSKALQADESFAELSAYLHDASETNDQEGVRPSAPLTAVPTVGFNKRLCQSEPPISRQGSTSVGTTRKRSMPVVTGEISRRQDMERRCPVKPFTTTPSGVMFNRRPRRFSPLKSRVVEPVMTTPSLPPGRGESRRLFDNQNNTLKPLHTLPQPTQQNRPSHPYSLSRSTYPRLSTGKLFKTPYRTNTCSSTATSSGSTPLHYRNVEVTQDAKRPRISGPSGAREKSVAAKSGTGGQASIKPQTGYLYQLRDTMSRPSLREYVGNTTPGRYSEHELYDFGVGPEVLDVTCANAGSFQFDGSKYFSAEICSTNQGVRTEDGGLLYLGRDGSAGLEEITTAFLGTPGVDNKLICEGWIANHYKWIVWKLAAMEVAFPEHFAGRCLTPDWVLCHLKYRYEIEIDRSHRSALKKVLERDDLCTRTMVLCVSSVRHGDDDAAKQGEDRTKSNENHTNQERGTTREPSTILEVTDGWYSVRALLDKPLTHLLSKRRIFVGQKLCINGAELTGFDQAVSPLEAPSSLMLRLHANSTRRARWDARLGFQRHSHPFPLPLGSLFPDGGLTGCVDVVILRRYAIEWMEKLPDGPTVFRNSRAEEREAKRFRADQERAREAVFAKIQRECEEDFNNPGSYSKQHCKRPRRSYSPRDIKKLCGGKEIYEVFSTASDPSTVEECLDDHQRRLLQQHRQFLQDNKRGELEAEFQKAWQEHQQTVSHRTVVPLLKLRVINCCHSDQDKTVATLSLWRPSEDVMQLLTEGSRLRIYHVMASDTRYRQGAPALQLSVTRSTRYKTMATDLDIIDDLYTPRKAVSYDELRTNNPPALYSEVDIVGIVVFLNLHTGSSLQTVYLADQDENIVAVKFWGGLKAFAVEDLVRTSNLIACSNLVVRSGDRLDCPVLCFNELSTLSLNPREVHLRTALETLKNGIEGLDMSSVHQTLDSILHIHIVRTNLAHAQSRVSPAQQNSGTTIQGIMKSPDEVKTSTSSRGSSPTSLASNATPCTTPSIEPALTAVTRTTGQCKRKLLDGILQPSELSPLSITMPDSVRREFKRPRRISAGTGPVSPNVP